VNFHKLSLLDISRPAAETHDIVALQPHIEKIFRALPHGRQTIPSPVGLTGAW
jgi:hypothetical protein